MTTSEIVKLLAGKLGKPQTEVKRLLVSTVSIFKEHLVNHNSFTIPRFGTFAVTERKERKAYNPHYKALTLLPKKVVTVFRPSKALKDQIK